MPDLMPPARRAALLWLLEDWEAGRMTPARDIDRAVLADLRREKLIEVWTNVGGTPIADLLPAGLSAARQAREQKGEG